MTKSDGKPVEYGTKVCVLKLFFIRRATTLLLSHHHSALCAQYYNDMWVLIANDFSEADAKAYVRMNWKDMTPYSVAKTLRSTKYKDLTDAQFEAMWYRQTLDEFKAGKGAFLEAEAREEAEKKAKDEAEKQAKDDEQAAAKAAEEQAAEQVEATGI